MIICFAILVHNSLKYLWTNGLIAIYVFNTDLEVNNAVHGANVTNVLSNQSDKTTGKLIIKYLNYLFIQFDACHLYSYDNNK